MIGGARLLVARNLRAAERTRGLIVLRAGIVAAVLVALWFGYRGRTYFGGPGRTLINAIFAIDYVALLVAGITLFPTLIADERERGTLPLLHLAGFRPLGFLLGQTLSALIGCLLVLFVQVPFLMLAVALGGTSPAYVADELLALLCCTIVVYAAALFSGAATRTSAGAIRLALVVVPGSVWLVAQFGEDIELPARAVVSLVFGVVVGVLAWGLFEPRGEAGSAATTRASGGVVARPRFQSQHGVFAMLAARLAFGGVSPLAVVVFAHFGLAVLVLGGWGRLIPLALGALVALQCALTLLHAGLSAAQAMQRVRRARVAGLFLLAGGPHRWLSEQRGLRMRVAGVHVSVVLLTSVLMTIAQDAPGELILVVVLWTLCAGFFADRFGEYCGLACARGALAVTVLGGGAIVFLTTLLGALSLSPVGLAAIACSLLAFLGASMGSTTVSRLPKLYAA